MQFFLTSSLDDDDDENEVFMFVDVVVVVLEMRTFKNKCNAASERAHVPCRV